METETIESTETSETTEESTESSESTTEETQAVQGPSDMERLVIGATKETKEESDTDEKSDEDSSEKGKSKAASETKKPESKKAADIPAVSPKSAEQAVDTTLLVEAGNAGMGPGLVASLAKAGPEALRDAIREWKQAHPDSKSQEEIPKMPKLDRAEFGDELVDAFEGFGKRMDSLAEENAALKSDLATVRAGNAQGDSAASEAEFDKHIADLSKGWEDTFGAGSSTSLKGTQAHVNREEVFQKMQADQLVREQLGQKRLPSEQAFKSALMSLHHETASKISTQDLSDKVKKNASQHISRPSNTSASQSSKPGVAKATKTAARKMKALGLISG